jgi:alkanesulfonate monooxygenase SsuD/methylene tetrahydromethanopterin reductase-like flavin-dependent oxidoreductase (luciferase family)
MDALKSYYRRALVINRYMLRLLGAEEAYEMVSKTLQYQMIAPTPAFAKVLEKTYRSLPVSDEVLERGIAEMMAVGTPSECIESVARFVKAGATHVLLQNVLGGPGTLERFAKDVIPVLRG